MSRRFRPFFLALLALGPLPSPQAHAEVLSVVTWGGSYQESQENAFGASFSAERGVAIDWLEYRGGLAELRDQVEGGRVTWDVVDVLADEAREGCEEGLFLRLSGKVFPAGMEEDLIIPRPNDCVGPNIISSWVTAFASRAFEGVAPASVADFFDLEAFPGRRAIAPFPQVNFEMALLADGVPPDKVYARLATEAGVDRAFAVLTGISGNLRFWSLWERPVDLLTSGEVAMTTAYNERIAAAQLSGATGIETIYDGQILEAQWLVIVAGTSNEAAALDFLRHAAEPAQQAALARWIPDGPMRRSALSIIEAGEPWFHTGKPVLPHIPSREDRIADALVFDPAFWAEHGEALNARFVKWRRGLGQ